MDEKDQKFAFAVAAMMGLVARGASPMEVADMMWVYADFAMTRKPEEKKND
jgi:hypothetical protein